MGEREGERGRKRGEREREGQVTIATDEESTCLLFWLSILTLTSGWRVKSGEKYSKYSVR